MLHPRRYKTMLKGGFRRERNRRLRMALLRNFPLRPAVGPYPRYVNNNAIAAPIWRAFLQKVSAKHPLGITEPSEIANGRN